MAPVWFRLSMNSAAAAYYAPPPMSECHRLKQSMHYDTIRHRERFVGKLQID